METVIRDLRHALIALTRNPAFSVAAIGTLALGIGATTAVFSIVYGVLLRPLPFPDPERLVRVWEEHPGGESPVRQRWLSNHTYERLLDRQAPFDVVGGYARYEYVARFGEQAARVTGSPVSPRVLRLLLPAPEVGRLFDDRDALEASERVVILSHAIWRERFGGDPAVVGRTLSLNWEPHTIVGVAPEGFRFPDAEVRFWVPYVIRTVASQPQRTVAFTALARLSPDVTPEQAEAEATAEAQRASRPRSTEFFFGKGSAVVVHVRPLSQDLSLAVRPALQVMAAAVALVLLIACGNVSNLGLSRGVARQREFAIRSAIGGSRRDLIQQLFTESAVLSAFGGTFGVVLASLLIELVRRVAPLQFPRLEDVRVDGAVLWFSLGVSTFAAIATGVAPAIRGARGSLANAVRSADRSQTAGDGSGGHRRIRDVFLAIESAFAVVLLICAGLLVHSFVRLLDVDAGYTAGGVIAARVQLPPGAPPERTSQFVEHALARLRESPGVVSAGAGNMMPLVGLTAITTLTLPERVTRGKPATARTTTYVITPGYAEALRMRLKEGRLFSDADVSSARRTAIVNEEFVRRYLSVSPVAGTTVGDLFPTDRGTTTEIVGVVGNILKDGNDREPQPEVFFVHGSATRRLEGFANVVIRVQGDEAALLPSIRAILSGVDPTAVIERIDPLPSLVFTSVAQPRFATSVMLTFGMVAAVLASIGLFGVLSYGVAQRRRELGVRAALGASRARLVGLVLRQALAATLIGVFAGLVAAASGAQFLRAVLFGIPPLDPVAFAIAPVLLMSVATVAALVPALRAASIDPATALRE
jgi:putative ABC transport system permease protein